VGKSEGAAGWLTKLRNPLRFGVLGGVVFFVGLLGGWKKKKGTKVLTKAGWRVGPWVTGPSRNKNLNPQKQTPSTRKRCIGPTEKGEKNIGGGGRLQKNKTKDEERGGENRLVKNEKNR